MEEGVCVGQWKDNNLHGQGKRTFTDGTVYHGPWKEENRSEYFLRLRQNPREPRENKWAKPKGFLFKETVVSNAEKNKCYLVNLPGSPKQRVKEWAATPRKVILSGTTVVFFYHRRGELPNDISQNIHQLCYEICFPFLDEIKNYLPKKSLQTLCYLQMRTLDMATYRRLCK